MTAAIALVGDYKEGALAHRAIPRALELISKAEHAETAPDAGDPVVSPLVCGPTRNRSGRPGCGPFFVGTLFQPERAALDNHVPPLVRAFAASASAWTQ